MDTAKEQGHEVNGGVTSGKTEFFHKKIADSGQHNGDGNQQFYPARG